MAQLGFTVFGGENSPYVWIKTPNGLKSWEFFDILLNEASIVGSPGEGFGENGDGYFRMTGFGSFKDYEEALKRIEKIKFLEDKI